MARPTLPLLTATLCLLCASLLSFAALGHTARLHPDEAFYLTIARHAAVNGDWNFTAEALDKPPLTYYLNALMLASGAVRPDTNGVLQLDPLTGEFVGRLVSLWSSVLWVAVMMRWVFDHKPQHAAVIAAGALALLSPLRIVFAPTAFTDMPMLFFGTLALSLAYRRREFGAGLCFFLSLAAKPQTLFYSPLLLFLWADRRSLMRHPRAALRQLAKLLTPLILGISVLYGWDQMRVMTGAASFYALGQQHYTPTQITAIMDYPARIGQLWQTLQYTFGHGIITGLWMLLGIGAAERYRVRSSVPYSLWIASFLGIHLALTLNLFDRNQLVLLPILIIWLATRIRWRSSHLLLFIVMIGCSVQAWRGDLPIGGDDGRHQGIDQLADYLNQKPVATVLYDPWLDWELDYYLGQWTNKRRVFYPTPELLVRDALALNEREPRYFIVPDWVTVQAWLTALEAAQFTVSLDQRIQRFRVYQLLPP